MEEDCRNIHGATHPTHHHPHPGQTPINPFSRGKGIVGLYTLPPTGRHESRGVGHTGGSGHPMGPPPVPGLVTLDISDEVVQAFAAELQGVVAMVVGKTVPSPSPAAPEGRVAALLLLILII